MRYNLAIIGGGINGCGIARDAAGRGLSVLLAEKGDLATATSSASTKLIHGGLRYLEQYEFRLVREALAEREVLLHAAPHLVRPLRFILPHQPGLRPPWMLAAGLFLYDRLAPRDILPASLRVDLRRDALGGALRLRPRHGFVYSDCAVDDARLCVLNARDAADMGADVRVGTEAVRFQRAHDHWRIDLVRSDGHASSVEAEVMINAAGPWASELLRVATGREAPVRLVQGSHIVVKRLYNHEHAYVLQNPDRRIVFVVPYERDFTLIGTTENEWHGDPSNARLSGSDAEYLCSTVNRHLDVSITPFDIVWAYAGVRSLYDDGASAARQATREYVLDFDAAAAPIITVVGGKITTYRRLAEAVLERVSTILPLAAGPWTDKAILPGGDLPGSVAEFARDLLAEYPFLPASLHSRLARLYGTRARRLLADVGDIAGMGRLVGADLYEREVRYLVEHEWARSADDIVWRRTKLGLELTAEQIGSLQNLLESLPANEGRGRASVRSGQGLP